MVLWRVARQFTFFFVFYFWITSQPSPKNTRKTKINKNLAACLSGCILLVSSMLVVPCLQCLSIRLSVKYIYIYVLSCTYILRWTNWIHPAPMARHFSFLFFLIFCWFSFFQTQNYTFICLVYIIYKDRKVKLS